jgi:hypothetical protein
MRRVVNIYEYTFTVLTYFPFVLAIEPVLGTNSSSCNSWRWNGRDGRVEAPEGVLPLHESYVDGRILMTLRFLLLLFAFTSS